MRVLIGFDGSECASKAIRDLQKAGLPADTEAVVLSVAEMFVYMMAPVAAGLSSVTANDLPLTVGSLRSFEAQAMNQARFTATEGVELIKSICPGWKVAAESTADRAHAGLISKAEQWGADLLVVGSHGRSGVGRFIQGSVSQQVLSYSPCSVRIGRWNGAARPSQARGSKLVLALDGSADSSAAVEAIMLRHWPADTQVRIVTAVDLNLVGMLPVVGFDDAERYEEPATLFRRRATAVAEQLHDVGLSASVFVKEGDPKRVLLGEAERWGADCIFIGAKGHSRLSRILLGSVSAAVAARAHCSVEIVR